MRVISDQASRDAALNPRHSFIVQAPAGSGKTGLLTQRFLTLLAHVEHPEECLAITFTRKAAAEMRERILSVLKLAASHEKTSQDSFEQKTQCLARQVLNRDKAKGWELLINPNRLNIYTIDALCANLTRQMPVLSRFGAASNVAEDPTSLYHHAAENLLRSLEEEEPWSFALRIVLLHLDNNLGTATRLLADMLSHRDHWLPYLAGAFSTQTLKKQLEVGLKAVNQDALLQAVATIPKDRPELLELTAYSAKNLQATDSPSLICNCSALQQTWPGATLQELPIWKGLCALLLTEQHTFRKTVTAAQGFPAPTSTAQKEEKAYFKNKKEQMLACLAHLQEERDFLESLQQIATAPPLFYGEAEWQMCEALITLLPILVAELSLVFQEKGECDFTEVAMAAERALGEIDAPTDLALALDYKIHHILVDEFQDTSIPQFQLLEKLMMGWQPGDGRTLFLVGDPMQSIYRFRKAEVGLFIRAKEKGVGGIPLTPLCLEMNFRSHPKIVEWVNTTFQDLFPKEDDMGTGAIRYAPSNATYSTQEVTCVWQLSTEEKTEAKQIVDFIKETKKNAPNTTIAILVRSRTHLKNLLPELQYEKIAYQGIQLERLKDRPIVQDLLSLTLALLHLGDRIAWLATLRSPMCHLSLIDLYHIANHAPLLPLWHTLEIYHTISDLSPEGKAILGRILPILTEALAKQRQMKLRDWVEETWINLGGAHFLYDDNSISDSETFLALLEEEEKINFYEVGVLEKRLLSLYAKPNLTHPDAVQIMTVHKAKGLEFDCVILTGLGKRVRPDDSKLLLWEEYIDTLGKPHLILAPIKATGVTKDPIYAFLKQQENKREAYEETRLFYVAATRAKKKLYCLTCVSEKNEVECVEG